MSFNGTRSGRQSVSTDALQTGLDRLDNFLEDGGIRIGSVVNVVSDAASLGEFVIANMIGKRPAYYYTLLKPEAQLRRNTEQIPNVNTDEIMFNDVSGDTPSETLRRTLTDTDYPTGGTLVVDPVNRLTHDSYDQCKRVFQAFEKAARESRGIGLLHTVTHDGATPENEWMASYLADTVLRVETTHEGEKVENTITITKLYPGQDTTQGGFKRFEIEHDLDLDITSNRKVNP